MRTRTPAAPLAHEDGIRAAYAAHGGELYRAARRLTGDAHHAEELVQETFLRAWRAADRFDERLGSLRTWLFGILRNLAIDHARAEAVRPLRAADPAVAPVGNETTADEIDRVLLAWQVEEALSRVSADHRRVLIEVHLRGRGIADVATELGVPAGTVKSRVYYGLRALRVALEELGWTEAGTAGAATHAGSSGATWRRGH
jgi:RNA polymerase sigma-70 factor (ECF subfamily)